MLAILSDRLTPLLQPSLRVLALDQRGHGEADKPADGYDLESLAGDVVAFLDAMDKFDLPTAYLGSQDLTKLILRDYQETGELIKGLGIGLKK